MCTIEAFETCFGSQWTDCICLWMEIKSTTEINPIGLTSWLEKKKKPHSTFYLDTVINFS